MAVALDDSHQVTSDSDVMAIRRFLEDAGVLNVNDSFISLDEIRGYIHGRVAR